MQRKVFNGELAILSLGRSCLALSAKSRYPGINVAYLFRQQPHAQLLAVHRRTRERTDATHASVNPERFGKTDVSARNMGLVIPEIVIGIIISAARNTYRKHSLSLKIATGNGTTSSLLGVFRPSPGPPLRPCAVPGAFDRFEVMFYPAVSVDAGGGSPVQYFDVASPG
ncbi:hypothetical protein Bbelb_036490 [Branchiostoma belcheri]|nr:hypothetical protein Bbelb_036490 [Branchiostoma belcheri]